jgi:hypothetical protein
MRLGHSVSIVSRFELAYLILQVGISLALPATTRAQANYDEAGVRSRLADSQLGGVINFYRQFSDPESVETVRRWDAGIRVVNISAFQRTTGCTGFILVVYAGTCTVIDGLDVILTTDPANVHDTRECLLKNSAEACAMSVLFCGASVATYGAAAPLGAGISTILATCNAIQTPSVQAEAELAVSGALLLDSLEGISGVPCLGTPYPCIKTLIENANFGCGQSLMTSCTTLDSNDGLPPFLAASTQSPVDIEIVDSDGNRMYIDQGGQPSSAIQLGLLYILGDHEQFAFIANPSSTYTIRIHGAASAGSSATFDFGLLLPPVGDRGYASIEYLNIPTRLGAIAQVVVNVDDSREDYKLALDLDGDGATERLLCPTTVNGTPMPCGVNVAPAADGRGLFVLIVVLMVVAGDRLRRPMPS